MQVVVGSRVGEPYVAVDLWASVPFDDLPNSPLEAVERCDWKGVREELGTVMDGLTTDGVYGRALVQFVMSMPLPSDPILARYRASICIDHGDWGGLREQLTLNPVGAAELIGVRDILLASPDRREPRQTDAEHERFLFEVYEFVVQRADSTVQAMGASNHGFLPASRRTDEVGVAARRIVNSRATGTTLSERELEVVDLAGHGLTNKAIAVRLNLSPHTIARHLSNARAKLGAANRAEAAAKFEEIQV
jgi:DNA-binding CsgD family transcriptional regulator